MYTGRAEINLRSTAFHQRYLSLRSRITMNGVKRCLGYAWSSPVTLIGVVYTSVFQALGWYRWHGVRDAAAVWIVEDDSPSWLLSLWKRWAGHTVGNIVVLRNAPEKNDRALQHELVHVRQCMRLGVFQPVLYALSSLGIWLGCESSDPYWSNPFEIDARRSVGQTVDVEGVMSRIKNKTSQS